MIGEEERRALADLALRALDMIDENFGEDAELIAASMVFEVRTKDDDGEFIYHGNYESLNDSSPHHLSGLFRTCADHMVSGNA